MRKKGYVCGSLHRARWIYKPADGNKAEGIQIFQDLNELEDFLEALGEDRHIGVIQRYLEKPWLMEHALEANDPAFMREKLQHLRSKKFDMRMFLLMTYEPRSKALGTSRQREEGNDTAIPWLKAYLHKDGICRFSTADYDLEDLSEENRRAHLTNNAINKCAEGYNASNNLISLQDLERLMPRGWNLEDDFYPFVKDRICKALALHIAGGQLRRRGFQMFGIDLMLVQPEDSRNAPEIYLLEVNLRPKIDIPDEVSVAFQKAVKAIIDDVIMCIDRHHRIAAKPVSSPYINELMGSAKKGALSSRENRFDEIIFNDGDIYDL